MVVIHKKKKETEEEKAAAKLKDEERALGIQDEYQAKGFELVSWIQDHKGAVTVLIITFFLIGAGFSGYAYYKQRSQEAATTAYIEALVPLGGPAVKAEDLAKIKEAETSLLALIEKYPNTGPALLAKVHAAHLALISKEPATAVELYNKALLSMNAKDLLYPLALIGLGYAEESNGNPKKALEHFAAVVDLKGNIAKDLALYEAARLALESKDKERAKLYVNRLLEEFPASMFEKDTRRLQESI